MKKKFLLITILVLLLIPLTTFAMPTFAQEYRSMNLVETLQSEDIELKNADYKENDKQATIYLFRGNGCTYCRAFLEFLSSISEEYGKYFKVVSYEVWSDSKNTALLEDVSEFLDSRAGGVPFIVIGDQVFAGYNEDSNDAIITAIKDQYDSNNKYDVLEELEAYKAKEARKAFFNSGKFSIICNSLITVAATVVIVLFMNKKIENLTNKVEELEHNLKVSNNKEEKEHNKSKAKEEYKKKNK